MPIGRRVAELRVNRGMNQQVFADRIGKSKSWVDKVERGVRTLDRLSVIQTVAAALGVAPTVLLAGKVQRGPAADADTGSAVERVREALSRYDVPRLGSDGQPASSLRQLDGQVGYAWTAYRNGHHAQVLRMLPDLLGDSRRACHARTDDACAAGLPVRVYRLAAQVLVKLGEADPAWLAADRAMSAAADDPRLAGLASVSVAQALRALRRGKLAMAAAAAAVHRLDLVPSRAFLPEEPALTGTLLTEAALAAAACGAVAAAAEFTERAAHLAAAHGERHHDDHDGIGFGPTTVELARALTAMRLGDHHRAVTAHRRATSNDAWHRLPAEHRAAHLIDITRAHLDLGDHHAAGRALVSADGIAPAETRLRPAAHAALTAVLRAGPTAADVARLAATIGLTRQ
ncbi:helix-turn-helix domain-containing protein [Micromonospora sp. NBC_01655]|uniref:helix-turn-helix domain-containing protein n=1 Tax=Micromonospora sp. NBC_01655 TaxID=2975983 RepID=UPI00225A3FF1|nr:helix-turn-helix domain-containing protein [Micromonospora sp. NBC_01655]MCX4470715.1 helix-turn-helix domain-containing protein [Micromonospora sp. NBC_01655]